MEHFYTMQGEGHYAGCAAYFIRLGGCDVGCFWCDVKESWPIDAHPKHSVEEIVGWVTEAEAKLVVITGGEPAMHDLVELTSALQRLKIRTHIETSGTHKLTGSWDWITFSPKKFKKPVPDFHPLAHELKVIVLNKHDLKWAQEHAEKVSSECQLFLQPEWDNREETEGLILNFIRSNPTWRMSVQQHKFLGIP
ncbi:MAG: 7-carboxy-7-deazaguanine synthase QueE [Flavobacteriales bacterium]